MTTKVCIVHWHWIENGFCILEEIAKIIDPKNTNIVDLITFELLKMFLVSSIK